MEKQQKEVKKTKKVAKPVPQIADPIAKALQLVRQPQVETDPEVAKKEISKRRKEIARLSDLKSDLLPIENDAIADLDKKIKKLSQDITSLSTATLPPIATMPIFDISCLKWRDEKGFPRLVCFSPDESKFTISCTAHKRWSWRSDSEVRYTKDTSPELPTDLKDIYSDVFKTLQNIKKEEKKNKKTISITATMGGTIPDHIRSMIQAATGIFQECYVIAEINNWEVAYSDAKKAPARSVVGDPLLVGFDGRDYRLIASFDTTPLEKLIEERTKGAKSN